MTLLASVVVGVVSLVVGVVSVVAGVVSVVAVVAWLVSVVADVVGVSPVPGGDGDGVGLQEHSAAGGHTNFSHRVWYYTLSPFALMKFLPLFSEQIGIVLSRRQCPELKGSTKI